MSSNLEEKFGIIEVPPASSSDDEDERFDQDRKKWAGSLNDEAVDYYREYFGVKARRVHHYENVFDGEYTPGSDEYPLQLLDYAGIDCLVDRGAPFHLIAERARPAKEDRKPDFSFRTENDCERPSEYDKFLAAYRYRGFYPDTYAFGIVTVDESRFESFYLIDTERFLECIDEGRFDGDEEHPSGDGTRARYYPVTELDELGCILESWGDGT